MSDGKGPMSPEPKISLKVSSRIGCGAVSVIHMARAVGDAQHAQRHQERGDGHVGHESAVDGPDDQAREQSHHDPDRHAELGDGHGRGDRGQPDDGAHRQVDLGGADDEGHGHGHHRDGRRLADDVGRGSAR